MASHWATRHFLFRDDDCPLRPSSPAATQRDVLVLTVHRPVGWFRNWCTLRRPRAMRNSRSIRCALQRVADKCMVQRPRCRRNTGPGPARRRPVARRYTVRARCARARRAPFEQKHGEAAVGYRDVIRSEAQRCRENSPPNPPFKSNLGSRSHSSPKSGRYTTVE